jgi:hypothetical protein
MKLPINRAEEPDRQKNKLKAGTLFFFLFPFTMELTYIFKVFCISEYFPI